MTTYNLFNGNPNADIDAVVGILNNTQAIQAEIADRTVDTPTRVLFTATGDASNGSLIVQQDIGQTASAAPSTIDPGDAFPVVTVAQTKPSIVAAAKVAQQAYVTMEDVKKFRRSAVETGLAQMTNGYADQTFGSAVAAIVAAVPVGPTNSVAGTLFAELTKGSDFGLPVQRAKSVLRNRRRGYTGKVLVAKDSALAELAAQDDIAKLIARENGAAPIYTGSLGSAYGLGFISIPDELCVGTQFDTDALVLDNDVFGGIAEQEAFRAGSTWLDQTRDHAESWSLWLAHNFAFYVANPLAACWITDVATETD